MEKASGKVQKLNCATVMMANIRTTGGQELAHFNGRVATFTTENTKKMNETGMGRCTGLMAAVTMVSGFKGFSMASVSCSYLMEISFKVSLKIISIKKTKVINTQNLSSKQTKTLVKLIGE